MSGRIFLAAALIGASEAFETASQIVSKRADAVSAPGNRGPWLKAKRLYREEFMVVGWTNHES